MTQATDPKNKKQTFYADELVGDKGGKIDISTGGSPSRSAHIVGDNVFVSGDITAAGGTFMGMDSMPAFLTPQEVEEIFKPLYQAIPQIQSDKQEYAQSWTTNLKFEALQGLNADPVMVEMNIRNIARIVPNLFQPLYAVLTNPSITVRMNPVFEKLVRQYASD